ncbi:extracellular solute-binding protein [Cohnella sp. GbtcB17]|uniref:extracellular solute-binding protein n=1 Tax=Cohnella sp. GbtcB17 TaxID=2824762 RepID=UPI001C301678|nr:extracellular solute-binding protein [Cohnella sp. GbtcB17]
MNTTGKKVAGTAMAGFLAVSLAACGSSNNGNNGDAAASPSASASSTSSASASASAPASSSAASGEKVTITFQNIYPDPTDPKYNMLHKIVKQYETDHPNVHIELDSLNTDQQKQKLKTQAASNEVPDITIVNPSAQMKPYVDAGLFAPLNEMVEQNGLKDTFQSGILDYYTFDGNLYALPDGNNIGLLYYNKALFKQAGIEAPPATFEDLIADVKKLKDKGIQPMAIGEKDTWTGSFLFMNVLLRTNGGPGFLQDVVDGKKTFEDPAFKGAVDAFSQLVQAGAFQEGATSFDYNAGENLFKTGKAAMYYMGSWATGGIEVSDANKDGNVGVFKFPTVGGKGDPNQFMLAPGSAFAVSKNSKHLPETLDFLNYFMLNYPKEAFAVKGAVGVAQKVDGDFKAAGYSDMAMEVLAMFKDVTGGDISFDNTMNPATSQAHLSSIQNLFVSKEDPAAVAKEHQQAYEDNKE